MSRVSMSQLFSLACPWLFTRRVGNRCEASGMFPRQTPDSYYILLTLTHQTYDKKQPASRCHLAVKAAASSKRINKGRSLLNYATLSCCYCCWPQ